MSAPQPPMVDAAASVQRTWTVGALLVRWLTYGVIVGMGALAILVAIRFGPTGELYLSMLLIYGLAALFIGATLGGTVGLIGGVIAVASRLPARAVRYGPTPEVRRPTPRRVWLHLLAWVAAIIAGWAGIAGVVRLLTGGDMGDLLPAGIAALLAGVGVVASAAFALMRVRSAAIAGFVIGPMLAFGGGLATIGASNWIAANPPLVIADGSPAVQGSPPGDESEVDGNNGRIPAPPPLYGASDFGTANLTYNLEELARYSLMIAIVDDPDIPPGTSFPAALVECPWATEGEYVQATTDIWFDTADDAAAIERVREYWVTNGATLVVDDPDLVVVVGVPGSVGVQFSIETTWDDELRLRMQSVCVPG